MEKKRSLLNSRKWPRKQQEDYEKKMSRIWKKNLVYKFLGKKKEYKQHCKKIIIKNSPSRNPS